MQRVTSLLSLKCRQLSLLSQRKGRGWNTCNHSFSSVLSRSDVVYGQSGVRSLFLCRFHACQGVTLSPSSISAAFLAVKLYCALLLTMLGFSVMDRQKCRRAYVRHKSCGLTEEFLGQVIVLCVLTPFPTCSLPVLCWVKHCCGLLGTRWIRNRMV